MKQNQYRTMTTTYRHSYSDARSKESDKWKLRMHKVPFIGHRAADQGLCVDPAM